MEAGVLHLVPAAGWVLRPQHVRGRGGGELPQVSRVTGTRGTSSAGTKTPEQTGAKAKE